MTHSTSVISHLYIKREAAGVARLVLFFCYVYEARAATTNRKRSEHIWCWKETDAWCAREFFALKNSKDYHSHHSRVAVRLKITKHHLEWTCVLLFVEIFHENELGRLFSFFFSVVRAIDEKDYWNTLSEWSMKILNICAISLPFTDTSHNAVKNVIIVTCGFRELSKKSHDSLIEFSDKIIWFYFSRTSFSIINKTEHVLKAQIACLSVSAPKNS